MHSASHWRYSWRVSLSSLWSRSRMTWWPWRWRNFITDIVVITVKVRHIHDINTHRFFICSHWTMNNMTSTPSSLLTYLPDVTFWKSSRQNCTLRLKGEQMIHFKNLKWSPNVFKMAFDLPLKKEASYTKINKSPNSSLSSWGRYLGVAAGLCLAGLSADCCDADAGDSWQPHHITSAHHHCTCNDHAHRRYTSSHSIQS